MMQYEFLNHFPKRMKHVGLYTVLIQNSIQKTTWQRYGFQRTDEQINMVFAVLLYIMEQSLKEEHCTIDDIGAFIDDVNMHYLSKSMSYEECKALGDFIVNVIFCNEGKAMYFDGFDYALGAFQTMHISYVANRVVYAEYEVKRTSYYLTDDGYNLLLGTLEIENNMQITIHEMIFKMHLEKQSYDKAVDDIKNVFNLLRIQLQKIQEAMGKVRRNALSYSVADYDQILNENLETIGNTEQKFHNYRELVKARAKELEEENINVRRLNPTEEKKLNHLKVIESYLTRTIDEHQRILNGHFDLKALYTKELEELSQMSLIKRFPIRTELYEKILEQPESLSRIDYFLRPLFGQMPEKTYNLNKALDIQRPVRIKPEEENAGVLEFGEEEWKEEQEQRLREKLKKYENSLNKLLGETAKEGAITLLTLCEQLKSKKEEQSVLIPNAEIFKEIMVELIKTKEVDIRALQKEKSEFIQERAEGFQLNEMLLGLIEGNSDFQDIVRLQADRLIDGKTAVFEHVLDEQGYEKTIRCSNVILRVVRRHEEQGKAGGRKKDGI